jgi:hypothetical protein
VQPVCTSSRLSRASSKDSLCTHSHTSTVNTACQAAGCTSGASNCS